MEQTIKRVVDLENKLDVKTGNQPDIESNSSYLQYHIGPEFNAIQFDDREGYKIRFASETEKITQLVFLFLFNSKEQPFGNRRNIHAQSLHL
jgi:hypothetical protein